jgi:NAD dependent epimerase/dehydratase
MKVLVTGAGGFIGSHVAEAAVRAGHEVRCLARYNSRSDEGFIADLPLDIYRELDVRLSDICDAAAMDALVDGCDAVLHLAALVGIPYSYAAASSYVAVNVQGTVNLLNAARRADCRAFVQTSTSEVYGSAQYAPIDELHPLVAQSPYAASKIAADKVAESFARSFGMPVVILRPFNTYGPRQSMRAIVPSIAAQLLDREVTTVRVGNTSPCRDFTFVSDTARAFVKAIAATCSPGEAINLGTGEAYSVAQLHQLLQDRVGEAKPLVQDGVRVRPHDSEVDLLISNNQKARRVLGWIPSVSIDAGLDAVVGYLRSVLPRNTAHYYV